MPNTMPSDTMLAHDDILLEVFTLLRSAGLSRRERARALCDLVVVLDARIERLKDLSETVLDAVYSGDDL